MPISTKAILQLGDPTYRIPVSAAGLKSLVRRNGDYLLKKLHSLVK
jgi:hypothetical protein